jgi:hypothetical protein
MPSRHELNLRARAVGFDPATIANDSKLEQKILYLEKNATTFAGTDGAQTLTTTGTFSDNETVTIGDQVYTMKTALTSATAANEVLIGAAATNSLDNLKEAINGTGTPGTNYGSATPVNTVVTAGTKTASTLAVNPRDKAVTNASIATTETATNASWGAGTVASGVGAVVAVPSANTAGVKDTNAGISGDKNVL